MNNTTPQILELEFEDHLSEMNSRRVLTQNPFQFEDDDHEIGASKRAELFKYAPKQKKFEDAFLKINSSNPFMEKELMEIDLEKKNEDSISVDKKKEDLQPLERRKEDSAFIKYKTKKLWRKKVFYILMLVVRFINIMKMRIIQLRIWETKVSQLEIVGDLTYFSEKNVKIPNQNYKNLVLTNRTQVFYFYNFSYKVLIIV